MINRRKRITSSAERLAYWYFRLNGFLTTENFVVHPDKGANQRTDADLLAVRFEHRAENLSHPMLDDEKVASCKTFANVIIAEAKTGPCALNGPWTDRTAKNMNRVIKAIGCIPEGTIDQACDALYCRGYWSDEATTTVRLFALGEARAPLLIPPEQQITWDEIISFCVTRFKAYKREKSSVGQWSKDGDQLRSAALRTNPERQIRSLFRLTTTHRVGGR
jgi:hypothetical protein